MSLQQINHKVRTKHNFIPKLSAIQFICLIIIASAVTTFWACSPPTPTPPNPTPPVTSPATIYTDTIGDKPKISKVRIASNINGENMKYSIMIVLEEGDLPCIDSIIISGKPKAATGKTTFSNKIQAASYKDIDQDTICGYIELPQALPLNAVYNALVHCDSTLKFEDIDLKTTVSINCD